MDWINKMVDTWHNLPALVFPQPETDAVRRVSDRNEDEPTAAPAADFDNETDASGAYETNVQHDNFLRGLLIPESARNLQRSRKAGVSYWRHGAGCSCKHDQSEEFHNYVKCQTARDKLTGYQPSALIGELDAPGMGLDADCLSAFLRDVGPGTADEPAQSTGSGTAAEPVKSAEPARSIAKGESKPTRQSALNHTQSPEYAEEAIQPMAGADDEVDIEGLFTKPEPQISVDVSVDDLVDDVVDDINKESWHSLKELAEELAEKTVAAAGNVDQEITQDLSYEDIKRMELIEIFGRSVLAAQAALRGLAHDADESVRAVVAQEYSCPDEILHDLANDVSETVRLSVVSNPKVPIDILETLSADDDSEVAQAAEAALLNHTFMIAEASSRAA